MKKDNLTPEDIYRSAPLNHNGAGQSHTAAASPHEVPVVEPMSPGAQARYLDYEDEEGIDPRQILGMLLRRWKIIAATFLTVLLLGVLYTLLAQPIYEARAKLLVSTGAASSSAAGELGFLSELAGNAQARKIDTEIEILKSKPVQEGALARLPAQSQASLEEFSASDVTAVRNTDLIDVAGRARDPKTATALTNAICNEYIEQSLEQSRAQVHGATNYVKEQLANAREKLDVARAALRNYKERHSLVELTAQSEELINAAGNVASNLRQAETERQASNAQAERLRDLAAKMSPTEERERTITRSPAVQAMQDKLTKLELDLAEARQEYTEESPEVQSLQREIEAVKRRLSSEAQTTVASRVENPNPVRQSVLQNLAQTQAQIWALDARTAALRKAQEQAQERLKALPEQEYHLSRLVADVEGQQQIARMLDQKYQELSIQEEANVPNARIVEKAEEAKKVSPRPVRNFALSALLGLMLALALAALVERMDDRVHSDEDVETYARLPILAHVPLLDKDGESPLVSMGESSPLLESYRMLRANIAFSSLDKPLHSVAVTSSQPGEGKSTTAANLASVMALGGKEVILVDADLRRPTVHRVMDLSNQVGFTSVVTGQETLENALQSTDRPNLRVLTSGPIPPNPFELLESQASRACFRQIFDVADFVVVDTAPVLAVADTQVVSTIVDGVLVVISCKEAGKREVSRMRDLLAQTGTTLVGTLLNKVPVSGLHGYYGGYGYNYHPEYQVANNVVENDQPHEAARKETREKILR